MKKYLLIIAMLFCGNVSFAGGYQLNMQGIRQLAMGGSGTALAWSADVMFYNPAALSHLNVWQASVSALGIIPTVQYVQGNYAARSQQQIFTPFNVYVGGPLRFTNNRLSFGVGIYTPFGSGLKWDDNWSGRYVTQEIALQTIFAQPTFSYKFSDNFSIGAGYVFAYGDVKLRRAIPITDANGNDGTALLKAKAFGHGFNAGIHSKLSRRLQVGLDYRWGINMNAKDGSAAFNVAPALADSFPNTSFTTKLPLPQVATLGIGYRISQALTLQADVNFTGWYTYDSLRFDFAENTEQLEDIRSPRNYKNSFSYRLGANYAFNQQFALMAGGAWDSSPVQDGFVTPDLPDADRLVLTCGFSFRPYEKITICGAVEYVTTKPRQASFDYENFSGTYQTKAITPGIGITYDF